MRFSNQQTILMFVCLSLRINLVFITTKKYYECAEHMFHIKKNGMLFSNDFVLMNFRFHRVYLIFFARGRNCRSCSLEVADVDEREIERSDVDDDNVDDDNRTNSCGVLRSDEAESERVDVDDDNVCVDNVDDDDRTFSCGVSVGGVLCSDGDNVNDIGGSVNRSRHICGSGVL